MNEPSKWAWDAAHSIEGSDHPHSTLTIVGCIQQAIDAATADALKIIDEKDKRIAAMAALLDKVPHFHSEYKPEDQMDVGTHECVGGCPKCASDCPRCAWERMKKATRP